MGLEISTNTECKYYNNYQFETPLILIVSDSTTEVDGNECSYASQWLNKQLIPFLPSYI